MSDVYDKVQSSWLKEDVRERLELIVELGKFLKWRRRNCKSEAYIHSSSNEKLDRHVNRWEGKVQVIQRSIAKQSAVSKLMIAAQNSKIDKLVADVNALANNKTQERIAAQNEKIDQLFKQNEKLRNQIDNELIAAQNSKIDLLIAQNEELKKNMDEGFAKNAAMQLYLDEQVAQNEDMKRRMDELKELLTATYRASSN